MPTARGVAEGAMPSVGWKRVTGDDAVQVVPGLVRKQPPRKAHRAENARAEPALDARERVLQESVVEARVVRDEKRARGRAATSSAMRSKLGASRTIALVMPVSAWISGGIGMPGLTSVLHSVTRARPSLRHSRRPGRSRPR
jgi:hypothetical protein